MSERGPYYQPGEYICRVTGQGFTESRERKLPMIVFTVEPLFLIQPRIGVSGIADIDENQLAVRSWPRTVRLTVVTDNEEQMDFVLRRLRYAGFDGDRFENLDLLDQQVRCICEHDTYENRPVEKWELALPPREAAPLDSNPDVAKRLNALFGRRLKETAPKTTLPTNRQPTPVDGAAEDDDIPF